MDKNNNRYTTTEKNVIVLFGCLTMTHTHASEYHNIHNECYVNDIVYGKKKKKILLPVPFCSLLVFFLIIIHMHTKGNFSSTFFLFCLLARAISGFQSTTFFLCIVVVVVSFFLYISVTYLCVCIECM